MYAAIARACFGHPWRVIGVWLLALVAIAGVARAVGDDFGAEPTIPAESSDGFDVLETYFGGIADGFRGTIVFRAEQGVDDPEVKAAFTDLFDRVDAMPDLSVASPYGLGGSRFISSRGDTAGTIAYAELNITGDVDPTSGSTIGREIERVIDATGVEELDGVRVEVGGEILAEFEPPESELIGLGFAVIVLILAMGSVLAMGTTITVAVIGVAGGAMIIGLLSNVVEMPDFTITLGLMIGLGVGIDYALFIVNRYRESMHHGHPPDEAIVLALDTAGRSVIFAGMTVVVSLLGMLLIGLAFIGGLGIGAATTVTVVMVASLTLLPATLGLVKDRLEDNRWRGVLAAGAIAVGLFGIGAQITPLTLALPAAAVIVLVGLVPVARNPLQRSLPPRKEVALRDTVWFRFSRFVQHRPWTFAIGGTAFLLVLAGPLLAIRLGWSDEGNWPEDTTTRQAYDLLAEGFGPGHNGPLIVALENPSGIEPGLLASLPAAIEADDGVASVTPAFPAGDGPDAAIIQVIPDSAPQDEATDDLVRRLRDVVIPEAVGGSATGVFVTGSTAVGIDVANFLGDRIVVFIGAVLAVSFLLLMAVFRSLLVPVKAVVMNMLSIGAAYGIIVAVFQWGWGSSVFGIEPAPIEPFIPMMMFAVVFGLSMDYEVFLLSRVKEQFERTGDPVNSVADGLAATAQVITAAAAIMVVVFGSFMFEDNRVVKLFGLGLASAVLIDATFVRMLLVPSTMQLLGARNWWIPAWLDRLLPRLDVEGTAWRNETDPFADPHESPPVAAE